MELFGYRWNYINEGNVHIVLQLIGTEDVLRLIKEDENSVDIEKVQMSANFVNLIMVPLLSGYANYSQEVFTIPQDVLPELVKVLNVQRPENRKFKSRLSSYAIKTQNLALLSSKCKTNYCVEIKPKEGFLCSNLEKISKCYYCLKQHLKLESNQIKEKSKFCPLDLFSGNKQRMKQALNNLVNNPQNNFKIFKDGRVIYSEKSHSNDFSVIVKDMAIFEGINTFLDFLIELLLARGAEVIALEETLEGTQSETNGKCIENIELKHDSFLYKLLEIQKLSESKNVNLNNLKVDPNTEYKEDLLEQIHSKKLYLDLESHRKIFIQTTNPINLALISAIAKDCSIMICFSPEFIDGQKYIQIGDKFISYRVSITDLEPKNVTSLLKRTKTENMAIEIYEKFMNRKKLHGECKIQPQTETRAKQLEAWQQLITEYFKVNKLSTLDVREAQNLQLFNNGAINRKLSQEAVLTILEEMGRNGRAVPVDKSKMVWEVYWHSLDEWGNMVYSWASNNGLNNSVCTLFELREGDNTVDEEFHGLDMSILVKALKTLEAKGKCELIEFDENQGVKFF